MGSVSVSGGYAGKVVVIDLSGKTVSQYPWSSGDRERCLGGKTMAAQILWDHLTGRETAFSEENRVVIATGPLTGTVAPGSGRFDIAALSPKDDLPAFSNCGGAFGIWLKKAGYDALILTGRSREACWLEICGDRICFHDAAALWGTGTAQCQEMLAGILGTDRFGRLCIGPAGENLVRFASVIGDGHAAGRAGIGAVLGYKNLKAITVSGSREIPVAAPEEAAEWNRKWYADLKDKAESRTEPSCKGCPLHCVRRGHMAQTSVLNDLGMDGIAAEEAAAWAAEQGLALTGLYEDIAWRRGIGDQLAEGVTARKGKGGRRRGGSYEAIRKAFRLAPEDPETDRFCRALTEAISAAGQCMFTVNGLDAAEEPELPVLRMLALVTGREVTLDNFLRSGMYFLELARQLDENCAK